MKIINDSIKTKRGLTVIEMLIAIVILGVVMSIATSMVIQSFNIFGSSTRRMSASQLTELAQTEVALHLRSAKTKIYVDADENIYEFDGFYEGNEGTLKFVFDSNSEKLLLSFEKPGEDTINRTIANNIVEFEVEGESNEFDIYIKAKDDNNTSEKRLSITSRNL